MVSDKLLMRVSRFQDNNDFNSYHTLWHFPRHTAATSWTDLIGRLGHVTIVNQLIKCAANQLMIWRLTFQLTLHAATLSDLLLPVLSFVNVLLFICSFFFFFYIVGGAIFLIVYCNPEVTPFFVLLLCHSSA